MGARQSKRSVDITTTPKKGDGEIAVEGEGKLEKIPEIDAKVTTNGTLHTEQIEFADKEETGKDGELDDGGNIKENGVPDTEQLKISEGDNSPASGGDQTVDVEKGEKSPENPNAEEKIEETPEGKKNKEKTKKKKWSLRSISFSKKDKSKPSKDAEKNGDVKEVAEETAEETTVASPSTETPKVEEQKVSEVATNGDATPDEIAKPAEEISKPVEEVTKLIEEPLAKPVEAPKAPEPSVKATQSPPAESAPSPVTITEDVKPEESTPKVEESKPVDTPIEETKEVRSEEVPPPLPTTNPPSPVTVFAESTKANALPPIIAQDPVSVSIVETIPESLVAENVVETIPQPASSPIVENLPDHDVAPIASVESTVSSDAIIAPTLPTVPIPEVVKDAEIDICQQKLDKPLPELPAPATAPIAAVVPEQKPEPIIVNTEIILEPLTNAPLDKIVNKSVESDKVNEVSSNVSPRIDDTVLPQRPSEPAVGINEFSEKLPVESNKLVEESIKPDSIQLDVGLLLPSPTESVEIIEPSPIVEQPRVNPEPIKESDIVSAASPVPVEEPASTSPVPEPISLSSEPVANADSLPDISTESLPSLPEPISDSLLPEPMSLPPVDSVPEPIIATETLLSESPVSDIPLPNETVLTNGNTANGLPSPVVSDAPLPPIEGPLKQVYSETTESKSEVVASDNVEASSPTAVEE